MCIAQLRSIMTAIAEISDVVCTVLQDKILQSMGRSQDVMVTNDGATILKSLYVDNPAAKVLVGTYFLGFAQPQALVSPLHLLLHSLHGLPLQ